MNLKIQKSKDPLLSECGLGEFIENWGHWTLNSVREALETKRYALYYASFEQNPVAALFTMLSGDCVDVIYIYCLPEFRTYGYAFELLKFCEKDLQGSAKHWILEVRKDNASAIRLYERFGMSLLQERKAYYKDGCDALVFFKDIK